MLRGNYTERMDEKGRIKLPAAYRRYIDEHYSAEFYVTSLTGECARLYPMPEWMSIEEKLRSKGTSNAYAPGARLVPTANEKLTPPRNTQPESSTGFSVMFWSSINCVKPGGGLPTTIGGE